MRMDRRDLLIGGVAAALGWANPGMAQDTGRPLRLIAPADAGSGIDVTVRTAQVALGKALHRPVVIENYPAAAGLVGTQLLVRSPPDGDMVMVTSNNHVVMPNVFKSIPFDVVNDVTPIAMIGWVPFLLLVNPNRTTARNVPDFVAQLRAQPDRYNFGSSGTGTIIHLISKLFMDAAKVDVRHIPYKGVSPQLNALMSGEIDFAVVAVSASQGFVKAGSLYPIAVMGKRKAEVFPEVKTLEEQGIADVDESGFFLALGPKNLPPKEVARLYEGMRTAYTSPEILAAMGRQNILVDVRPPQEAAVFLRTQREKYAAIARSAGIVPE